MIPTSSSLQDWNLSQACIILLQSTSFEHHVLIYCPTPNQYLYYHDKTSTNTVTEAPRFEGIIESKCHLISLYHHFEQFKFANLINVLLFSDMIDVSVPILPMNVTCSVMSYTLFEQRQSCNENFEALDIINLSCCISLEFFNSFLWSIWTGNMGTSLQEQRIFC